MFLSVLKVRQECLPTFETGRNTCSTFKVGKDARRTCETGRNIYRRLFITFQTRRGLCARPASFAPIIKLYNRLAIPYTFLTNEVNVLSLDCRYVP